MSSKLRQPTQHVRLTLTQSDRANTLGVIGLRCQMMLYVLRTDGVTAPHRFIVDSGASYSIIGYEGARRDQIIHTLADEELTLPTNTAQGRTSLRVRPGQIRAWWNEEQQGYPFTWPVLFRLDAPEGVPAVLGLGGIVKTCTWLFDGRYSDEAPYGQLTLEDTR